MAHVREVPRKVSAKYPRRIAYETSWREGDKKMQRTFPVKRDADRFAMKVDNAHDAGESTRSMVKNTATVAQVVAASMESSRPKLKPRTFHSYELMYTARVLPKFGSRRVSTVNRADVQAWVNSMTGEGLAPATIHHHYVALKKAMKHAPWDRQIAFNPLRRSRPAEGAPPAGGAGRADHGASGSCGQGACLVQALRTYGSVHGLHRTPRG